MALSKARNRERMRKSRLHKQLLPLTESKPVQPRWSVNPDEGVKFRSIMSQELDADGNAIPELT